jgi:AcrR family transcriptional regulator
MPKVWSETIEAHRRDVRDAILSSSATLLAENGLRSVTMSQVAERSGIGRATLYKYFPSVQAILLAWHEEQIAEHLEQLAQLRDQARDATQGLKAVLEAYALIEYEHHGSELATSLHQGGHMTAARQQLHDFIRDLLTQSAKAGDVRSDVSPDELASYCIQALGTASSLPTKAAVGRLVSVTLAGLGCR